VWYSIVITAIIVIVVGLFFLMLFFVMADTRDERRQCLEHGYPEYATVKDTVFCIKKIDGTDHVKKLEELEQ
jgi:hypothetical protein